MGSKSSGVPTDGDFDIRKLESTGSERYAIPLTPGQIARCRREKKTRGLSPCRYGGASHRGLLATAPATSGRADQHEHESEGYRDVIRRGVPGGIRSERTSSPEEERDRPGQDESRYDSVASSSSSYSDEGCSAPLLHRTRWTHETP